MALKKLFSLTKFNKKNIESKNPLKFKSIKMYYIVKIKILLELFWQILKNRGNALTPSQKFAK